ncbi:Fic family protein [Streptomyces sp. NPDC057557]|uniref:Fic family protein n=1 Tax=Streptomyces sp. NPDC057557 TaxID=3346167 RepID=UPI0036C2E71D
MARVAGESRRAVRGVPPVSGRRRGPAGPVGVRRPEPDRPGGGPDRLWQRLAQALSSVAHLVPQPLGSRTRCRAGAGRPGDRRAAPELYRPRHGAGRGRRGAARPVAAARRRRPTARPARAGPPGALAGGARRRAVAGRPGRRRGRTGNPVARRGGRGHPRLRRRVGPRPRRGPARRPGTVAGRRGARRPARLRTASPLAAACPRRTAAAAVPQPAGLRQRGPGALRHRPDHRARFDACLAEWTTDGGRPLPLTVRAARAYLDVRFFHPFDDGNARSAFLVLVFVLAHEGSSSSTVSACSVASPSGPTTPGTRRPDAAPPPSAPSRAL